MSKIEELRLAMERAAKAMDFEEASRLRDQISLLRLGDADAEIEDLDPSGLIRQQPGAMGLGTSQQSMTPPAGWVRPKKPDPLTANRNRRAGQASSVKADTRKIGPRSRLPHNNDPAKRR